MKNRRLTTRTLIALFALVSMLVLGACSSNTEPAPEPVASEEPISADSPPASPEAAPNEAGALIVTTPVNAIATGFEPSVLDVPADEEFTLTLDNQDSGIPHNIQIFEGTVTTGKALWAPKDNAIITGPATAEYEIPALSAGTYTFNCFVHPTMVGTITVA